MATWADRLNQQATGQAPQTTGAPNGAPQPQTQAPGWASRLNQTVQVAQKTKLVPSLNTQTTKRPGLAFQRAQMRAEGKDLVPSKLPAKASIGSVFRDPDTKRLFRFGDTGWKELFDSKNFPKESVVSDEELKKQFPNGIERGPTQRTDDPAPGGAKGFMENLMNAVGETVKTVTDPNPANFQKKIDLAKQAGEVGKTFLRAFPRAAASVAVTATGYKGKGNDFEGPGFTPGKSFNDDPTAQGFAKAEKFLFGDEPIKDIRTEGEDMVKMVGGDEKQAKEYGLVVGAISTGLDIWPSLPKKSIAKKLAEEGGIDAVRKILSKEVFKNASDDILHAMATKFSKITDAKLIEKEIDFYSKVDRSKLAGVALGKSNDEIIAGRHASLVEQFKNDPDLIMAVNKTAQQVNEPPGVVKNVLTSLDKVKTNVIEYVQNEGERVRKLMDTKKYKIDDLSDPYLKATLYPGRVSEKIKLGKAQSEEVIKGANKVAKEFGTDLATTRKEINDYLYFKHAPERNAIHGENAAGITTEAAKKGLETLENSPRGAAIRGLAEKAATLHKETLQMLKDSGVISDKTFETLNTTYKNHVPLQRIMEQTEDVGVALSGKGFDVKSSGLMAAKGSDKEVDDILGNIVTNYEQAAIRSEKNIVDQATLAFARKNEDSLKGIMEVVQPKPIGESFGGGLLYQKTNDPSILQMFENGKQTWIKIADPKLAVALRAVGKEKLGGLMNAVASFTRLYSGLATRFNPEFALPNKIRDLQETAVHLAAQKGVGFTGAAKTVIRDTLQQNTKAVIDSIRGADTEGARMYQELKSLGGTTGGFGLSTKETVKLGIKDLEQSIDPKTMFQRGKGVADKLINYVDNWNTVFEDSTRLSVYRQGLKQGLSKDRAAALAKEASINFNRMGKGGPVINALWMFSNASIQGSTKMIKALRDPKVLAATTLAVGGSVAAVNEWNDRIDPDWRNKVTKWDRLNGLPVMMPGAEEGGAKYFTIPVSWGIKPIKVMTDYTFDSLGGRDFDIKDFAGQTLSSIIEAYNPTGGTDLTSALTPTALDIPSEIARNKSWTGNKIRPDFDKNAPADVQYFDSLEKTGTGRKAIDISAWMQEKMGLAISPADIKYAVDGYIGGAGKAVSKTINTIMAATGHSDEPMPVDEYPMISRFYREIGADEITQQGGAQASDEIKAKLSDQSRERFKLRNEAQDLLGELKKLPKDEANKRAQSLEEENPQLFAKVKDLKEEEDLGLNKTEKLMKDLGTDNGERAKYILEKISLLDTSEQKNKYFQNLVDKKVITDEVYDQIYELKQNPELMNKKKKSDAGGPTIIGDVGGALGAVGDMIVPTASADSGKKTKEVIKEGTGGLFGESSTYTDYQTGETTVTRKKGLIEKGVDKAKELLTGKETKPLKDPGKTVSGNLPEVKIISSKPIMEAKESTVTPLQELPKETSRPDKPLTVVNGMGRNPEVIKKNPSPAVKAAIENAAKEFGVPKELLYDIGFSEGGFRADAKNESAEGKAVGVPKGLFQFTPYTWDLVKMYAARPDTSLKNFDNADPNDPEDNARAAAYLIKFGQLGKWQASKPNWGRFWTEDEIEKFYSQTIGYEKGKTFTTQAKK